MAIRCGEAGPQAGTFRNVARETAELAGGVRLLAEDPHDRALIENVHPPGWLAPQPAKRYDLVVIGAGTAGLVSAAGAAQLGARVALVERGLMGGDCLNVGCVPSKALLRAARAAAEVREAGRFGVRVPPGVEVDFPAVMERMRRLRARISPYDSAVRFRDLGVDVFLGTARFTAPDVVEVDGARLRFSKAIVATGARAAVPAVPGLAEAGFLTNESVFALTRLPPRLAVIGAGPVGCELAQAFARFGSQVTILAASTRVLPRDEPRASELVERALERDGVERILGARVRGVGLADGAKRLVFERLQAPAAVGDGARAEGALPAGDAGYVGEIACPPDAPPARERGEAEEIVADEILVAVGRAPNVEGLALAAGEVEQGEEGIRVDERLRTTNPRVYAAGDVCSGYRFTHVSDALARIALRNALFAGRARASALVVPWCTFTDPEVARVGLSAEEARARSLRVRTFTQELREVDRAILDGQVEGVLQLHVRARSGRIVGATLVAAHAGETISEITLAIVTGRGLRTLAETIHPYPTQAEAIRTAADAWSRTRLTPLVRRLLASWLSWRR
jgi:pyruvate/2-oxoglutarate dehydrogenase complex dihydrolipoamide dehydrogenase (E3) component